MAILVSLSDILPRGLADLRTPLWGKVGQRRGRPRARSEDLLGSGVGTDRNAKFQLGESAKRVDDYLQLIESSLTHPNQNLVRRTERERQ